MPEYSSKVNPPPVNKPKIDQKEVFHYDRITSLDFMLKQIMESHGAQVRAYKDLEGKLDDIIEMLRKRTPYCGILKLLKAEDSNEYQFQKLW